MPLPAYTSAAHTGPHLLIPVSLLELRTPISGLAREGTCSHANRLFRKAPRRERIGEHCLAAPCRVFREHLGPLCWTHAVTGLSLVCLVSCPLVLLSLSCCGGCAGHRTTHEAVARALDSLYSRELPVHLSISHRASLFLLNCSAPCPLPPTFSHTDSRPPHPLSPASALLLPSLLYYLLISCSPLFCDE